MIRFNMAPLFSPTSLSDNNFYVDALLDLFAACIDMSLCGRLRWRAYPTNIVEDFGSRRLFAPAL